ncbi:MAG: hypothetical protein HKN23_00920 [Verrucomicrobiales bacterium]|nr:hypothetical protein [Verrucomicrobiales bacterium]
MLSRKNKNRRRSKTQRLRSPKTNTSKKALLSDEYQKLDAKIGVLEDFITGTVVKESRREKMRSKNILPPPEQWGASFHKKPDQRKARWEERQHLANRERSGLTFLALFFGFCLMVWWLINLGV